MSRAKGLERISKDRYAGNHLDIFCHDTLHRKGVQALIEQLSVKKPINIPQ